MTKEQIKLYEDNLNLVPYLYHKYSNSFSKYKTEQEEFIAEGRVGLLRAVKAFDENKGYKFTTYASRCILNQMYMYLRGLNKNVETVRGETIVKNISYDKITLFDTIATNDDTEYMLESIELKELLKYAKINVLTNNEYNCLVFHLDNLPQRDIAEKLNITQCSVSRLLKKATNKLIKLYEENIWRKRNVNVKFKKRR